MTLWVILSAFLIVGVKPKAKPKNKKQNKTKKHIKTCS